MKTAAVVEAKIAALRREVVADFQQLATNQIPPTPEIAAATCARIRLRCAEIAAATQPPNPGSYQPPRAMKSADELFLEHGDVSNNIRNTIL